VFFIRFNHCLRKFLERRFSIATTAVHGFAGQQPRDFDWISLGVARLQIRCDRLARRDGVAAL